MTTHRQPHINSDAIAARLHQVVLESSVNMITTHIFDPEFVYPIIHANPAFMIRYATKFHNERDLRVPFGLMHIVRNDDREIVYTKMEELRNGSVDQIAPFEISLIGNVDSHPNEGGSYPFIRTEVSLSRSLESNLVFAEIRSIDPFRNPAPPTTPNSLSWALTNASCFRAITVKGVVEHTMIKYGWDKYFDELYDYRQRTKNNL